MTTQVQKPFTFNYIIFTKTRITLLLLQAIFTVRLFLLQNQYSPKIEWKS